MLETIKVNSATCDGCGKFRLGHNDFEPVPGIVGTVQAYVEGYGSQVGQWYACTTRCIGNAGRKVLKRLADLDWHAEPEPVQAELLSQHPANPVEFGERPT